MDTPAQPVFANKALEQALDQIEARALRRQRVPVVPLDMARALQDYATLELRRLSKRMGEATGQRRQVLLAMGAPDFPAELYIAKIRAQHDYRRAARDLERAKRRSGIAFRALERAVHQSGGAGASWLEKMVAETRRSFEGPRPQIQPATIATAETKEQMFLLDVLLQEEAPAGDFSPAEL